MPATHTITQPTTGALWLYVLDEWVPDGFVVYLNGLEAARQNDMQLHAYPIPRLTEALSLQVEFGGPDGGRTAVVRIADGRRQVLAEDRGLSHAYLIAPQGGQP